MAKQGGGRASQRSSVLSAVPRFQGQEGQCCHSAPLAGTARKGPADEQREDGLGRNATDGDGRKRTRTLAPGLVVIAIGMQPSGATRDVMRTARNPISARGKVRLQRYRFRWCGLRGFKTDEISTLLSHLYAREFDLAPGRCTSGTTKRLTGHWMILVIVTFEPAADASPMVCIGLSSKHITGLGPAYDHRRDSRGHRAGGAPH